MAGCAGDPEHQAHIAAPSALLPGLHLLRGWDPHVGPVERAAGVHGHLLGLRMVRSSYFLPVFRIWIDPCFFSDPDPDFKNPDPSINKPMGSQF